MTTGSPAQPSPAQPSPAQPSPAQPSPAQPDRDSLAAYQSQAWVSWVVALLYSNLALHNGHFSRPHDGALACLDTAEAAASSLPEWAASVVHVRRAHVLVRESRYREAVFWLRRVYTAARQGHAHPAARLRAQLVRAKMRYDQARYDEAEHFLGWPPASKEASCPHGLNMNALLTGRKFLLAPEAEAPQLLAQTFSGLAQALGHVFLWQGDTSLLDGLCYNFGNNLLRGIHRGVLPESCADTAMQWLAANMLVCRKLGIGEDSVLADLLLIDVGLEHGYSTRQWPELLRAGLNVSSDLKALLERALSQARRTGNRLEIAQCLRRQMRLAPGREAAQSAYFEAVNLFTDLGRKDTVAQLAEEWRTRFGTAPPRGAKGRSK